jgi:antitoxin MazE
VKTNIIKIGRSRVVRIPKRLLDQIGLAEAVELLVVGDQIRIQAPGSHPHDGQAEAARAMAARGDKRLLAALAEFDKRQWAW